MAAYLSASVYLLFTLGIWDQSLLKGTILWSSTVAVAFLSRILSSSNDAMIFKNIVLEMFKMDIIFEFIVSLYTFNYLTELILIPSASFLILMDYQAGRDEKNAAVKKITTFLLTALGCAVLAIASYRALYDIANLATFGTAKDFLLPFILTALYVPFLFILFTYSLYERVFISLKFKIKDENLRKLTKRKLIKSFWLNVAQVKRWQQMKGTMDLDSEESVQKSIDVVKHISWKDDHPTRVSERRGWSPQYAERYLKEYELETDRYHPLGEEFWWAQSKPLNLEEDILPNNAMYYIEGNESAVTSLKLKLYINNPDNADIAEDIWRGLGDALILCSTKNADVLTQVTYDTEQEVYLEHHIISIKIETFLKPNSGYEKALTIKSKLHQSIY